MEIIVPAASIIVAIVAVFIAMAALKHQMITLMLSQLHEKAKECNGYLSEELQVDNTNIKSVSGILSAIVTAEQIIALHYQHFSFWLWFYGKQFLIDNFHLQLHTSIRVWISQTEYSHFSFSNSIIENQLKKSKLFLSESIKRHDK